MPKITEREFKASYELGIEVHKRNKTAEEATIELVDDYQMNEASAKIAIDFLQHMLNAQEYRRTLSAAHVEYYATRIFEDFGEVKLKKFLAGLSLHIKYRKNDGVPAAPHCAIHNEFSKKIGLTPRF